MSIANSPSFHTLHRHAVLALDSRSVREMALLFPARPLSRAMIISALAAISVVGPPVQPACAQTPCVEGWRPGVPVPVISRTTSLAVEPNDDVVLSGYISPFGSGSAVLRWNGDSWMQLGPNFPGIVYALAVLPGGAPIAAGHSASNGNPSAGFVVRWDGASWIPLGEGMDRVVDALAVLPGGDLVAGGHFTTIGTVSANYVARWNGDAWASFGEGPASIVTSLAARPNGDVVVGDWGGMLARWDGSGWSDFGTGSQAGIVWSLAALPNGDVIAGGWFEQSPFNGIARGNGTSWEPLGSGLNDDAGFVTVMPNGDVIAAGAFSSPSSGIARWNGTVWSPLGSGIARGSASALAVRHNGELVVATGNVVVPGQPSVPYLSIYSFGITCRADFNCSGRLQVQDIFDFLIAWFNSDLRADFSGDGLSVQDIFDFLNAWFAGCP